MKPSVYIESSVISYLVAKPSRDIIVAGHQQITEEWWHNSRKKLSCYVSSYVIGEIELGDEYYAKRRLEIIKYFDILNFVSAVEDIANEYLKYINIPDKAKVDAYHLAIASYYGVDYLVSWNCKHIANAVIQKNLSSAFAHKTQYVP